MQNHKNLFKNSSSESIEELFERARLRQKLKPKHIRLGKFRLVLTLSKQKVLLGCLALILGTILLLSYFSFSTAGRAPEYFAYLKGSCPDFTGRQKYLDILKKTLVDRSLSQHVNMMALWGKGGYGKSELAIEFANRFRSHFSLIWTFYCDSSESIADSYRDLAQHLGIFNPADSFLKVKEKVHFKLENDSMKKPWLLIFDNVEDGALEYPQRGGSILITSQKKVINPKFLIEIEPLTIEESLQLLERITEEKRNAAMELLVRDLEGIPLLINYAAHYIKATPGASSAEYQQLFCSQLLQREGPLWKEMDVNRRYLKSLASSWHFPLKALEKENPLALEWLFVCSYLYSENIHEEWIDDWLSSKSHSPKQSFALQRKEILKSLLSYGIIHYQETAKTFSVHRFFQSMIRESRGKQAEGDLRAALFLLGLHATDYNFFEISSWSVGKNWYLHATQLKKWLMKYPQYLQDLSSKQKKANFYTAMAGWKLFNYQFTEAKALCLEALDLRKTIMPENTPPVAYDYGSTGWCYYQLGRFHEALAMLMKAEKISQNFIRERPLEYIDILNTTGLCFYDLRDYEQAYAYYYKALNYALTQQGDKRVGGLWSFDQMTYCLLINIGRCLCEMGRYAESMEYYNRGIVLGEKSLGKTHPYLLYSHIEKARLISLQGEHRKALKTIQSSVDDYFKLHGEEYGELANAWNTMGQSYFHLGDFKNALKMFKKSRQVGLKYFGEAVPIVMKSCQGLGWTYLKQNKVKKGLSFLLKELKICTGYGIAPQHMAAVFEDFQKALQEAEASNNLEIKPAALEAHRLSEKALGKDHPLTLYFLQISQTIDKSKVKN